MALWITVLSILAFLLLLLLLPIRLTLTYAEELCVTLSVFGVKVRLYPKKKKVRVRDYTRRALERKRRRAAKKAKKEQTHAREHIAKKPKTVKDHIRTVKLIALLLKKTQRKLRWSFRIRVCRLYSRVATGDAASTALLYGAVSQLFAYILALADEFLKTAYAAKDVRVDADYLGTETKFDIKLVLTSNLWRLIGLAASALFAFLGAKGNVRTSSKIPPKQSEEQTYAEQQPL